MNRFAVLGSGGWGTAMAIHLARRPGRTVRLWCHNPATACTLREDRINHRQLPNVRLSEAIEIHTSVPDVLVGAECIVLAVPTIHLRAVLSLFVGHVSKLIPIVSLTKGIEKETFLRPSQLIQEVLATKFCVVLSGPSHAEEVAQCLPTSVVVAGGDAEMTEAIQHTMNEFYFRVYKSSDVVGVELAGALKNVMGIAAGICDGLGYGDNAKSALLTRALMEMKRFGSLYGAKPETFDGLAGLGDLITTCFSKHGRNRRVGEEIARNGITLEELHRRNQIAEGIFTARSVYQRVQELGLVERMPILCGVYQVIYHSMPAREAVQALLTRSIGDEFGLKEVV